jgi:hypothetical protein
MNSEPVLTIALRRSLKIEGDSERRREGKSMKNPGCIYFNLKSAEIEVNLIVTQQGFKALSSFRKY